jgi:hypothetical protein
MLRSLLYALARGMGDARSQQEYHCREYPDDNRENDICYLVHHDSCSLMRRWEDSRASEIDC